MGEYTDIDLNSMSAEELESFINSNGQSVEDTSDQSPAEEDSEDTTQTAEPEPAQEESEPEPQGQTDDDQLPEFYRGKSARELVEMLEDNKKFVSRQGNEIGQLRREIESFKGTIEKKFDDAQPQTKAEKKDFVDELISEYGYDKKDVEVIAKLVEHKATSIIQQREQEQKRTAEQQRQAVAKDNQSLWDNVRDIYPNAQEIESAMIDEIQKDGNGTLYKPGWVKSFLKRQTQAPAKEPVISENGAKKRVARAATVKSASVPKGGNIPPKEHLTSKTATAEEYRAAWNYYNPNSKI